MKKLISIILLISLITIDYRRAEAVAIPTGVGVGVLLLASAGIYYYTRSGSKSAVSSGMVQTASDAYWYSRAAATVGAVLMSRQLTAKLALSTVQNAAIADPSSYPLLASHAQSSTYTAPTITSPVGSYALNPVTNSVSQITSHSCGGNVLYPSGPPSSYGNATQYSQYIQVSGSVYKMCTTSFSPTNTTPNLLQPVSVSDFSTGIAPAGSVASDPIQDELDKMMQDPAYVPEFTDNTTGLPYAPPAGVLTPEQADARIKTAEAVIAAQSAVAAAQTALNNAEAARSSAVALANANPADDSLRRRVEELSIAVGTAAVALEKARADLAKLLADVATADLDDPPAPVDPLPQLKSFNWTYANKLLGQLETAWPFNLLLSLRGLFAPLESSPAAPSFNLPLLGNIIHIDLSPFNPLAAITRWVFTILLTSFGIMAVVRWYRGVS